MHSFYILYSPAKAKYYIGATSDLLHERLRNHNSNHKGLTGGTGDWVIVYTETFQTREEALKKEKEVKTWKSRKMIEALIKKI